VHRHQRPFPQQRERHFVRGAAVLRQRRQNAVLPRAQVVSGGCGGSGAPSLGGGGADSAAGMVAAGEDRPRRPGARAQRCRALRRQLLGERSPVSRVGPAAAGHRHLGQLRGTPRRAAAAASGARTEARRAHGQGWHAAVALLREATAVESGGEGRLLRRRRL
jgi:hypothetical protein